MGQSFTSLTVHVIFGSKDRRPLITPEIAPRLYDYVGGIVRNHNGQLLAAGGTADHVHLLVALHVQSNVADMVRVIKANASKWVRETLPVSDFAWQVGYGAFTVSHSNRDDVRRYIATQAEHHRRVSFDEEFVLFLKRHGVAYDPPVGSPGREPWVRVRSPPH